MSDPFLPPDGVLEDSASLVTNSFIGAVRDAFNPNDTIMPPLGGGSLTVRFLAGAGLATELWDAHVTGTDCTEPFLWVQVTKRFRFSSFPTPASGAMTCELPRAIALQIGVARCFTLDATVNWNTVAQQSEISLSDSWRIELALCRAVTLMKAQNRLVATEPIIPHGPEGGILGWAANAVVKL